MEPSSQDNMTIISKLLLGMAALIILVLLAVVASLILSQSSQDQYVAELRAELEQYSYRLRKETPTPPSTEVNNDNPSETAIEPGDGISDNQNQVPESQPATEYVSANVYFTNPQSLDVKPSPRQTSRKDVATYLIEQMIIGPAESESLANNLQFKDGNGRVRKITSATEARTFFNISIVGGDSLEVNFIKPVAYTGDFSGSLAFQQLKYTLTQFSNIHSIYLTGQSDPCWDDASGLCSVGEKVFYTTLPNKKDWKKSQRITYKFECDNASISRSGSNVSKFEYIGTDFEEAQSFIINFAIDDTFVPCNESSVNTQTFISIEGYSYQYSIDDSNNTVIAYIGY